MYPLKQYILSIVIVTVLLNPCFLLLNCVRTVMNNEIFVLYLKIFSWNTPQENFIFITMGLYYAATPG